MYVLNWSERRIRLADALGAAIREHLLVLVLRVTPRGERFLEILLLN